MSILVVTASTGPPCNASTTLSATNGGRRRAFMIQLVLIPLEQGAAAGQRGCCGGGSGRCCEILYASCFRSGGSGYGRRYSTSTSTTQVAEEEEVAAEKEEEIVVGSILDFFPTALLQIALFLDKPIRFSNTILYVVSTWSRCSACSLPALTAPGRTDVVPMVPYCVHGPAEETMQILWCLLGYLLLLPLLYACLSVADCVSLCGCDSR